METELHLVALCGMFIPLVVKVCEAINDLGFEKR